MSLLNLHNVTLNLHYLNGDLGKYDLIFEYSMMKIGVLFHELHNPFLTKIQLNMNHLDL